MEDSIAMTIFSWIIRPFTLPDFWLVMLGIWIGCAISSVLLTEWIFREYFHSETTPRKASALILCALAGPVGFLATLKDFSIRKQLTEAKH